jgi:hypothetical protein
MSVSPGWSTTREPVTRRTRALRYGASIAVALAGVACGATISGTAGGTAATVLVGIGLVGVVSLIFYDVGLTEDRDRAASERRKAPAEHEEGPLPDPDRAGEHQGARPRPLDRRRGRRRRLR